MHGLKVGLATAFSNACSLRAGCVIYTEDASG
jgi:hypothetical protein